AEVQIVCEGRGLGKSNEMNLRDFTRRLSPGSKRILITASGTTIVVSGLLCLLAGFTIVKFVLNFDQLQSSADEYGRPVAELAAAGEASGRETTSSDESITSGAAEDAAWLAAVNRYRAMVGVPPVIADAELSRSDALHSH